MVVIAILFWLWFLMSVVILVRRAIRRSAERRRRRAAMHDVLHDQGGAAGTTQVSADDTWEADAPVSESAFADSPVTETALVDPPAPTRAPAREPAPEPVARATSTAAKEAATSPTPAPVASQGSPAPTSIATIARTAAAPLTVAQVIAGIEMPCGLVPLTLSDHDMRYDRGQRAHFFTTLAPAEVVGTVLGEELERIGLTLTPMSDNAVLAQRGRLAVEVRINTVGALVDGIASTIFRSAPPNCVVVEFDVVPV